LKVRRNENENEKDKDKDKCEVSEARQDSRCAHAEEGWKVRRAN
jgi:hypothetical protein